VILSEEEVRPGNFPSDSAWKFATITDPSSQCITQTEAVAGTPVSPTDLCYYGQHVSVISETGELVFDGDPKVWWLQKRSDNFWKALITHYDPTKSLIVSAVDVGDLLESTPDIAPRMIRVEFNLLQNVTGDSWFTGMADWSSGVPASCSVPTGAESIGCFAAVGMSGAVPGTEQSGNELQGTDFGPGGEGAYPGSRALLDPTSLRKATTAEANDIPVHALVYSSCARLLIQKISNDTDPQAVTPPVWAPGAGQWSGESVGNPLINVATYASSTATNPGPWSVEITSGGSIVYGYNWNAKTADTGLYRLTFVLDGQDDIGPKCLGSKTEFGTSTQLVNLGENFFPNIIAKGNGGLGDEGGLVYIDIPLTAKGGGGGGGKPE